MDLKMLSEYKGAHERRWATRSWAEWGQPAKEPSLWFITLMWSEGNFFLPHKAMR